MKPKPNSIEDEVAEILRPVLFKMYTNGRTDQHVRNEWGDKHALPTLENHLKEAAQSISNLIRGARISELEKLSLGMTAHYYNDKIPERLSQLKSQKGAE